MLARRLRGQAAADESAPMVLAEVDRLDTLLKSLLVFGADEPGRLRQQPLLPVLERTLALVTPQSRERGIDVEISGAGDVQAHVDGDHLQQAFMNLLLNAIDAAGPGGRVFIEVRVQDGHIDIDVRDSGPGPTQEQQEHLFEAFYTTKNSGTGLGLAVTRTLLEKMGARIEYVAADAGAHFRIRLASDGREASLCARAS
jgi:two-component system sporulation sensor kinase A